MRALDEDELRAYLELAKAPGTRPEGYSDPETTEIAMKVMMESGFLKSLIGMFEGLRKQGMREVDVIASLWFTGMQMGREFETRFNEQVVMERMFGKEIISKKGES